MNSLKVRRLETTDLPLRVEWFNSPSVYTKLMIAAPFSLADTHQWFSRNALAQDRRDFCVVARSNPEERTVAMCGLTHIDHLHRRAELYIVVAPDLTGHGIGRVTVQWLCNYGFVQLNLHRIFLYTLESNGDARRFYKRIGFVQEGMLRKHAFHNGGFVNRYIHGLLREDWDDLPWKAQEPLSFEIDLQVPERRSSPQ